MKRSTVEEKNDAAERAVADNRQYTTLKSTP